MAFDQAVNKQIGFRLREKRECQGLTRERLAEQADISIQFLADIETGRKGMTVQTLRKLVLALKCSSDELLFGTSGLSSSAALLGRIMELDADQSRLANQILDLVVAVLPPADPEK